jgi:sugar/nucleoside kinase (ribokinase family)
MRLWSDSVGLITRSGADLEPHLVAALEGLGLDLSGWRRYDDLPTPRGLVEYDDHERMLDHGLVTDRGAWFELLGRPLALSEAHLGAECIHLITEFGREPMAEAAHAMRRAGALLSLEPIFEPHSCPDRPALLDLARKVDIVTPDWPAASSLAGSDDLAEVLRFWAGLGPRAVAIRRGSHGSYVWDAAGRRFWHIPPLPVAVVDPTGAGNAYGGGWCVGWHRTHDARRAGCYGAASAATILSHAGMPDLDGPTHRRAAELFELALGLATPLEM